MQKSNFMASMILMEGMIVELGLTAITMKKSEDVQVEAKISYDLLKKTMGSFFKSVKAKAPMATYSQKLVSQAGRYAISKDAKVSIARLSNQMMLELGKHSGLSVHHDTGAVWNKTKTDSKRFTDLEKSMSVILKSVS